MALASKFDRENFDRDWQLRNPAQSGTEGLKMTEPNSPREAVEQHRAEVAAQAINRAKFKVGDVVVLRSGGPRMTVFEGRSDHLIATVWFAGDLLQRDAFAEAELENAPPKETP